MYKTNRLNHDFQIAYFIAGACHTPDAAWSQLCDLEDDRVLALNAAKAASLRTQAAILRAQAKIASEDEADRLDGQADLMEIEDSKELTDRNIAAAESELATIRRLKDDLEPLRRFKHLSKQEAHQAAQAEEWKLHLLWTAQNQILSTGSIAHDYLGTMRMHPQFKTEMLPKLDQMRGEIMRLAHTGGSISELSFIKEPQFNVVSQLESEGHKLLPDYSTRDEDNQCISS